MIMHWLKNVAEDGAISAMCSLWIADEEMFDDKIDLKMAIYWYREAF
jgi:TPR repeat protein